MLRALAGLLSLIAVAAMGLAIKGMVSGRPGARAGYWLRLIALLCFGGVVACAVALTGS